MDNHVILRTILIILAAVVLFSLVHYYNSKQSSLQAEKFYEDTQQANRASPQRQQEQIVQEPPKDQAANAVKPSEADTNSEYKTVDFSGPKLPDACFPKDRVSTEDLLPKDAANLKWSVVNPAGQGDVSNMNFIQAGAMLGINSTLGSKRNSNLQFRSDPVIPNDNSEWPIMMSTIPRNSALLRRPLEISGDCGDS